MSCLFSYLFVVLLLLLIPRTGGVVEEDALALAQHEGTLTVTHRLELTHKAHTTQRDIKASLDACVWLLLRRRKEGLK